MRAKVGQFFVPNSIYEYLLTFENVITLALLRDILRQSQNIYTCYEVVEVNFDTQTYNLRPHNKFSIIDSKLDSLITDICEEVMNDFKIITLKKKYNKMSIYEEVKKWRLNIFINYMLRWNYENTSWRPVFK